MSKIDTTPSSPVLIRTYKKEAELEVWKMKSDGQFALLKTYPMCRWSGQLGPKKREGDMQVPEGFYTIAPGQMNPNSHYYLAFNVGYPNAYDRAYDRTGGNVMVHGVCSSAGCFSMTDEQINDIYAIARDAFRGGQREIQLQSYPFHMTAENLAKYRLDPNIDFWKELKNGSDHFEVTKTEPSVVVCAKHYVFGANVSESVSATAPCPALHRDESVEAAVAEKESDDNSKVAELVAKGVKPIQTVYADGGQNPVFAGYKDTSDPDALASGPQDIVLEDRAKPVPAAAKVATADASRRRVPASHIQVAASPAPAPPQAAAQPPATGRRACVDDDRRRRRPVGREHAEREEVAPSWRPGNGSAGADRRRTGSADSHGRASAAAAGRVARAEREAGASRPSHAADAAGQARRRDGQAGGARPGDCALRRLRAIATAALRIASAPCAP